MEKNKCERCEDYKNMKISDTCPGCDLYYEETVLENNGIFEDDFELVTYLRKRVKNENDVR